MSLTDERYKQLMADVGMPNSRSLLQALQQVANEVAQKDKIRLDDLVAITSRLVRALRKAAPDNDLIGKSMDYLIREGLAGSPLREIEAEAGGDCNDTGWLENREEGRYPCTCMTEAEPYQILEAKCAELEAKVEQLKMVPMKYRRMEFNAQLQRENMELRVERDALAAQLNRVRRALDAEP